MTSQWPSSLGTVIILSVGKVADVTQLSDRSSFSLQLGILMLSAFNFSFKLLPPPRFAGVLLAERKSGPQFV